MPKLPLQKITIVHALLLRGSCDGVIDYAQCKWNLHSTDSNLEICRSHRVQMAPTGHCKKRRGHSKSRNEKWGMGNGEMKLQCWY